MTNTATKWQIAAIWMLGFPLVIAVAIFALIGLAAGSTPIRWVSAAVLAVWAFGVIVALRARSRRRRTGRQTFCRNR